MVGVVDKAGPGATRFKVGQRVADLTVIGAYSEYLCLPENQLTVVPEGLDPAEAVSLVLSYVTAYQMRTGGPRRPRDSVSLCTRCRRSGW